MSEIKEKFGTVTSKDLYLKAWFKDSFWEETQNATSVTQVVKDGIQLKVLGKKFWTFKPRVPMTIYIAVQRTDGTPYAGFLNRQIIISRTHQGRGSSSYPEHKDTLLVLDALTQYAYCETNRDIYQMEIRLEATNNPAWKHTIMLNSSNFATLTTLHLDRAWGQMKAYAKGTGYAYMHLESMWNTEKKDQIDTAGRV